jgi:hypothetical protein
MSYIIYNIIVLSLVSFLVHLFSNKQWSFVSRRAQPSDVTWRSQAELGNNTTWPTAKSLEILKERARPRLLRITGGTG